jgi:hypothetical protein
MKTKTGSTKGLGLRAFGALAAGAILIAGLTAFATPAWAGHGHGGHRGHAVSRAPRGHIKVPRVMGSPYRRAYAGYYAGNVYYAPHHHRHLAYRFPVYVGGVVVTRPYEYCGGNLFIQGAVMLPRLAIGLNFGAPYGGVIGGYYVQPPPGVFSPAPYYHNDDWDD